MDGKKLALFVIIGTILACALIFFGFQLYFKLNPTQ